MDCRKRWLNSRIRTSGKAYKRRCQVEVLVEPAARGLGIGARLVSELLRFAKQAGYKKITLYTHKNLAAAIHIYQKAGFHLVREETEAGFGPDFDSAELGFDSVIK